MKTNISLIDLSYLVALCDGDNDFMNTIITSFIEEMPETLRLIQQKMQEGDWEMVGQLAHKIKPSVQFVGMNNTVEKTKTIEVACRNLDICPDRLGGLVRDVTQETTTAIAELQAVLAKKQPSSVT
jgi:HPt (histidine-containing phosphotransfer) domain-containing protein